MMYIRNSWRSPSQGLAQVAKVEGSSSLASCELSLIFKWTLCLVPRVGPRLISRLSRKRSCSAIRFPLAYLYISKCVGCSSGAI
ncbi:hypothetical protein EJD97_013446 [Solanum chilense]|uniref:Uncharacterized protein n=1 Tax=Solanum chilense TaxID=4083 RepID=A0A6N2BGG6_SOLCI|nr:hypothetical protein EJD97_013446 [Solanum chilense]